MLPLEKFPLNNFPLVLDGHCSLVLISKSKIMVSQCLCYLSFWQEIFILSQFRFCQHLLLWFPQISTISMWQLQGSGVPVLSSAVCFPVPALLLLVAVPSGSHRQSQLQAAILHFGLHLLSLHWSCLFLLLVMPGPGCVSRAWSIFLFLLVPAVLGVRLCWVGSVSGVLKGGSLCSRPKLCSAAGPLFAATLACFFVELSPIPSFPDVPLYD